MISPQNKEEWIEKASSLSKAEIEREVVKTNPKAVKADRIIPINASQSESRGVLSEEARKILERVKELEASRTSKNCDLDLAIIAMGHLYLQKNAPIEKATRAKRVPQNTVVDCPQGQSAVKKTRTIPAKITHQVNLRDQGKCRVKGCGSRHYTHSHHIRPFSHGGRHNLDNLVTLCSAHHRAVHNEVCLEFEA